VTVLLAGRWHDLAEGGAQALDGTRLVKVVLV
jgi:hypothetical protein